MNVERLCAKALDPIDKTILGKLGADDLPGGLKVGSVCMYPARVCDAKRCLSRMNAHGRMPITVGKLLLRLPGTASMCNLRIAGTSSDTLVRSNLQLLVDFRRLSIA